MVYYIVPCFNGNRSTVGPDAYIADIEVVPSRPTYGEWVRYDATTEKTIMGDFQRLWTKYPLADLSIDIRDYRFSNGVIGKLIVYNFRERN